MGKQNVARLAFNRGRVSKLALPRIDIERTELSAEIQTNWEPRSLGSMSLRPGIKRMGELYDGDEHSYFVPMPFGDDDFAYAEFSTAGVMRIWLNDELVTSSALGSGSVTNPSFTSNLTGWTDQDEAGAASAWQTGGYMALLGTGSNAAIRQQQVTVASGGVSHTLKVVVARGPVTLQIGDTSLGAEILGETVLGTGTSYITFDSISTYAYVQLMSRESYTVLVDSAEIVVDEVFEFDTGLTTEAECRGIRWAQSADVIFLATGSKQKKIERRGDQSWSFVDYDTSDGPVRILNVGPASLTPSAITGDITIAASIPVFNSDHVGSVWSLTSTGQTVTESLSGADQFSDAIRVTGIGNGRVFSITVTGTWTATVTLQRSVGDVGSWTDVASYTTNQSTTYNDSLDNQIIYYRIGIKTGNYTSGTAAATLSYAAGSITGYVKITSYTDSENVGAVVLQDLGGTAATRDWAEGAWSDYRGWPTAVAFHEGRLWWAGIDSAWGSASDAYYSFDIDAEGDSATVSRPLTGAATDTIRWMIPVQRLLMGGRMAEFSMRSSSFDEIITVENANVKAVSSQGSANCPAVQVDTSVIFAQRNGSRVYELAYDGASATEYSPVDLTSLFPEAGTVDGGGGFVRMAVARQPDTRVFCVRDDGTMAVLVFDKVENVICWYDVETEGDIEDVWVAPSSTTDDRIYVSVRGPDIKYIGKFALPSECLGEALNRQADAFGEYSGTAVSSVTFDWLADQDVVVWANGEDLGTITANSSGVISLGGSYTSVVAGLPYTAQYKTSRLAYGAMMGTPLLQKKRVTQIGVILKDTHRQGLTYGPDFDTMDDLPLVERGTDIDTDEIVDMYDEHTFEFGGRWDTDSRVCLQAQAPRPCTVLAMVMSIETHDKG